MAVDTLMAPIPNLIVAPGMIVRFEAVDPTTGAAVAGVKVKSISIVGVPRSGLELEPLGGGDFLLVPGPDSG